MDFFNRLTSVKAEPLNNSNSTATISGQEFIQYKYYVEEKFKFMDERIKILEGNNINEKRIKELENKVNKLETRLSILLKSLEEIEDNNLKSNDVRSRSNSEPPLGFEPSRYSEPRRISQLSENSRDNKPSNSLKRFEPRRDLNIPELKLPYSEVNELIKTKIQNFNDGNLRVFSYGDNSVLLHGKTACMKLKDDHIKPLKIFKYSPTYPFGPGWVGPLDGLNLLEKEIEKYNASAPVKIKVIDASVEDFSP